MARSKAETDELVLALIGWGDADAEAALIVATVNDGTHETGALVTLGHAGCTVVSAMATVAELLDLAEEMLRADDTLPSTDGLLARIRDGRLALGIGLPGSERLQ